MSRVNRKYCIGQTWSLKANVFCIVFLKNCCVLVIHVYLNMYICRYTYMHFSGDSWPAVMVKLWTSGLCCWFVFDSYFRKVT